MTLSDPQTRDLIADGLASLVRTNFHQVDVVAGTATAGIAHAALAADRLGAPMAYVRSVPKDHGRATRLKGVFQLIRRSSWSRTSSPQVARCSKPPRR